MKHFRVLLQASGGVSHSHVAVHKPVVLNLDNGNTAIFPLDATRIISSIVLWKGFSTKAVYKAAT